MNNTVHASVKRAKRNRRIRRRRRILLAMKLMLAVIAVIILTSVFGIKNMYAKSSNELTTEKYFKSITIEPGDTLTRIAGKYCTEDFESTEKYINEVKFINNLESDKLYAGGHLVVPYYSVKVK